MAFSGAARPVPTGLSGVPQTALERASLSGFSPLAYDQGAASFPG